MRSSGGVAFTSLFFAVSRLSCAMAGVMSPPTVAAVPRIWKNLRRDASISSIMSLSQRRNYVVRCKRPRSSKPDRLVFAFVVLQRHHQPRVPSRQAGTGGGAVPVGGDDHSLFLRDESSSCN